MLLINKQNTTIKLIATLSEVDSVLTGCTLDLINRSTNVNYSFDLPTDTSTYPDRYNEFVFNVETFSGLTPDVYVYNINQDNSTLETGLLKVVNSVRTEAEAINDDYVFIPPTQGDSDYIVYSK